MSSALVWFRRDLRHYDHSALAAALAGHAQVHCAFVFDREILDALGTRADRRVTFIWDSVAELREALQSLGGGLHVLHGELTVSVDREFSIAARDELRCAHRAGVGA